MSLDGWNPHTVAWAAGFYEGEGSLYARQNKMSITSTDHDVLRRFLQVVGCGKLTVRKPTKHQLGKKPQFRWDLSRSEDVRRLTDAFYPHLGERRRAKIDEWRNKPRLPARGEVNGKAKLTADAVTHIRESAETGAALARRYGVTEASISAVRRGITWRHV